VCYYLKNILEQSEVGFDGSREACPFATLRGACRDEVMDSAQEMTACWEHHADVLEAAQHCVDVFYFDGL